MSICSYVRFIVLSSLPLVKGDFPNFLSLASAGKKQYNNPAKNFSAAGTFFALLRQTPQNPEKGQNTTPTEKEFYLS